MEQTITILARQISNLTDARYFAAKEVQGLVFNLEEGTEGFLDPMHMQAMREWVEGPAILGEFGLGTSAADVIEAVSFFKLDAVVLPANFELEQVIELPVYLKIKLDFPQLPAFIAGHSAQVRGWILELPELSGSWVPYLTELQALSNNFPIFLHYHGPAAELKMVLDALTPAGLTMSGGVEEAVGIKSFEEIDAIFELLEQVLG